MNAVPHADRASAGSASVPSPDERPARRPAPLRRPPLPPASALTAEGTQVFMHQYDALRSEVQVALSNQVSVLSFASATVGLLFAAAATLWNDEEAWLSSGILLGLAPAVCFLAMSVYLAEQVRVMRAGYFLHCVEELMAEAWGSRLLSWEHWIADASRRPPRSDVDWHNTTAVLLVYVFLTIGSLVAGAKRIDGLASADWPGLLVAATAALTVGSACSGCVRSARSATTDTR